MTTPFVSRAEWGARPRLAVPPQIVSEGVTAHYGGPSPWGTSVDRTSAARFMATADHARCASICRAWQSFHMDDRGWNDIAYNSMVCPHGYRFDGRGVGVRSGAQGTNDGNARSEAVCYIAGDGDPLTTPAKEAFLDEAVRMEAPALRWIHSDWHSTACPGAPIRAWKAAGWPDPTPIPTPEPDPPEEDDDMPKQFQGRFIVEEGGTPRTEVLLVSASRDSVHWIRSSTARKGHQVLAEIDGASPEVCIWNLWDTNANMKALAHAIANLPMIGDMPPAYAPIWKGPHLPGI